ncbi:MAG: ATP synthase F0 subunit B [Planctomycetota bacterium]|nr:MAG: ATP synthase F0 subunit B [Planctomycetota bacterium]
MEDLQYFDPATLAVMGVLFLAGTWLLWRIFWKPLVEIMERRERTIRDDLKAAEEARARMAALKEEYERKIEEIERKAQGIIAEAVGEAKARSEKMERELQAELKRKKEQALAEIERERRAAVESLRSEVADLALTVARAVLGREVSEEDHRRFVQEMLEELEAPR